MTKREFAMVISRVLALIILFQAVTRIELVVAGVYQLYDNLGEDRSRMMAVSVFLTSFLPMAAMLLLAAALWGRAGRFAQAMLHGTSNVDTPAFQAGGVGMHRLIVSAVGLYLLSDALPKLTFVVYLYFGLQNTPMAKVTQSPEWRAQGVAVVMETLVGAILMVCAKRIVALLEGRETPATSIRTAEGAENAVDG